MNSEKTTLLSLRNIEWRTVKTEMNKIAQVIPYITTNNKTEFNGLIYAETQIKKSTKTGQNDKTKERCWNT